MNIPKSSDTNINENFYRHFQQEVAALQNQIGLLTDTSLAGIERNSAIDKCLSGIAKLQEEVKDASNYLPAYDQRTYSETVKGLLEKVQNARNAGAPRQKFSFKSARKTTSSIPKTDATRSNSQLPSGSLSVSSGPSPAVQTQQPNILATQAPKKEEPTSNDSEPYNQALRSDPRPNSTFRRPSFTSATTLSLTAQTGLYITLPPSASSAMTSGSLTALSNCVIDMSTPSLTSPSHFSSLALRDITDSLIITGPISGPLHATNVRNSVLVAQTRQFRMHDCRDVDVYLHSASRPIIEDCSGIRFAPMPETFLRGAPAADAEGTRNLWDQVDDFKWLKAESSPNWRVLGEEDRVLERVWGRIAAEEAGLEEVMGVVMQTRGSEGKER